jgi:hypothetical protein
MMEVARNSERSANKYFNRLYIQEDKPELHNRRLENLKYHFLVLYYLAIKT